MRRYNLVLLHGQPGTGADWQHVIAMLPEHISAVALDRPGHGSSRQAGGGLDVNAAAVIEELDARGIDRAVLVGHSYGGGVALSVAARAPDRVEAVVLLASVGPDCLNGADRLLAAPVAGAVCALFAWRLTPWFARVTLRLLARRQGWERAARRHVNWHAWGFTTWENGPLWRTFLAEQKALVREAGTLAGLAAAVRVPALIVADPRDSLVPLRTAVALSSALQYARLHPIDGAGHHLPLRAPEEVAREIVTFLGSLADQPPGEQILAAVRRDAARPQATRLERAYLLGLRALGPLAGGELHALVLLEVTEPVREDRRVMDEDVGAAVVWCDEAVTLARVKPLHGALRHELLLYCGLRGPQ
jgi:pimeloyl-ACP methyl ester carboxylesterase